LMKGVARLADPVLFSSRALGSPGVAIRQTLEWEKLLE
jgi:hypothetical protein